jgi:hypothetical protein
MMQAPPRAGGPGAGWMNEAMSTVWLAHEPPAGIAQRVLLSCCCAGVFMLGDGSIGELMACRDRLQQ